MLEETKDIVISDIENDVHFRINLFGTEKGLDFIDSVRKNFSGGSISIKPFLDDLLPLASLLDTNGEKVVKQSLTRQDCYSIFRNPFSVLELGVEIFEFQMVFMKSSKAFRPLAEHLQNILNIKTLGSETK